mmetsp:Transcript_112008/g.327556  ORF Transcript_112008/g.327556 Transcript_112008/m.327556 type:complete len:744 (-) Transcript_112008:41-2272(-)
MSVEVFVRPDGVAVVTLKNPPVNTLCTPVKNSFMSQFPSILADPKVKAIVVTGAGKFYSGGFEISEFDEIVSNGGPADYKDVLGEMFDALDHSSKTTVAAINGQALGGGFEAALCCHYRVAAPSAVVAFPEVTLGLLPGGQGTQRLPRLAPLETVTQMILTGGSVKAPQALAKGIVDAVASGNVVDEAAAFALAHGPKPVSRRSVPPESSGPPAMKALDAALAAAKKQSPGMIAPDGIIACLRAACSGMSFEEGLKVELREFVQLLFSVQSKALRHLFFAERTAAKVPGITATAAPLKKIGILGAGLMGGGIAMCFAQKGVPVVLKDAKQEWLDDGVKKIRALWEGQAQKGKITKEDFERLIGLIKPTLRYEDLADVDAVIEAVPEIMDLKQQVFRDLEKHCRPDAFLWTNTSGLNIDEIASVLKDPSRAMGCHFFSPANVMQLLENVRTKEASDRTLAAGMAMGKLISKKTVLVGNCDGFVGNRMAGPYLAEAKMLLEEGATVEAIDAAAMDVGMAMGPHALGDLVGLELFWKQRKALGDMKRQTKTYYGPYELGDWLCDQGRFGMKTPDPAIKATGRGMFIHRGREKSVDPEVVAKIQEVQKQKGMVPRSISKEEITERLFFPLINEGFKILDEGYATRPSDIDIVYIFGYSFPTAKGGPMFYAENFVGLPRVLEGLRVYAAQAKERYTTNPHYMPIDYFDPSPLLVECASKQGMRLPPGMSLIETVLEQRRAAGTPSSKL